MSALAGTVLLSGANTLLGAELLGTLGRAPGIERIRVLLPRQDEADRAAAFAGLLAHTGPLPAPAEAVYGDPRQPLFGLGRAAWEALGEGVAAAFHCPRPDRPLGAAAERHAHLRPAEGWARLLAAHPGLRLHHLSSAFVGGDRWGLLTEFDLDCGQGFRNPWERAMFEAEQRLRESPAADRVTVYRPSHTLGRAADGAAYELGGGYPLLAALAGGGLVPADPRARLDLVPADYVAGAVAALAADDSTAGGTYHLVAGWSRSAELARVRELVAAAAGGRRARTAPQAAAPLLRLLGAVSGGALSPNGSVQPLCRDYLRQSCVFDDYLARLALDPRRLACPEPEGFLPAVVRAAAARGWRLPPEASSRPEPLAALDGANGRGATVAVRAAVEEPAARPPEMDVRQFLRVGDYELAYRDLGPRDGAGAPAVFLHGFAGAASWDGVVDRLRGHHRCLVVETVGLGDSRAEPGADLGLPAQAAALRGLLSALGLGRVHLVGNDTGGAIAQLFAVRWPGVLASLVLSDCDAFDNWPGPQVERLRAMMRLPGGTRLLTALMGVPAVARSRAGFRRLVHDPRLLTRERLRRYLAPLAADRSRRRLLRRFFRDLDPACTREIAHLLHQLEVPTMIVWGCEDAYWSPSWAKKLHDEIPGARRLELIPFAGLSCHEERPEVFARLLGEFFSEVGGARGAPVGPD